MRFLAMLCITLALFGREFNHTGYGLTLNFPDNWHLHEVPQKPHTRRTSICTLFPFSDRSVFINFTTCPKRQNELQYYLSDSGKEKLQRIIEKENARFIPNAIMQNFTLINTDKGLGYSADFLYSKNNRYFRSFQRAYMGVVQYYMLTLIAPANRYDELRPLFDEIALLYPRVRANTSWSTK